MHDILGIARGTATIEFGGVNGIKVKLDGEDVAILPAGTGHRLLEASKGFLGVAAYPPDGAHDECTDTRKRKAAIERILKVKPPKTDPIFGSTLLQPL